MRYQVKCGACGAASPAGGPVVTMRWVYLHLETKGCPRSGLCVKTLDNEGREEYDGQS